MFDLTCITRIADHYTPPALVKVCKKRGTDDFCEPFDEMDEEFDLLPPLPRGYEYLPYSGLLLKMNGGVQPHTDCHSGRIPPDDYEHVGNVFGLVVCNYDFHIQVANDMRHMNSGDWIFFDDRLMHCVVTKNTWMGIAVQVFRHKHYGRTKRTTVV